MTKRKAQSEYTLTPSQRLMGIFLDELGLDFQREAKFCEQRDWRIDIIVPGYSLGIEIHGGQFTGGHRRGWWNKKEALRRKSLGQAATPQEDEYDKINYAQLLGWTLLQFTNDQVDCGYAKEFIKKWLEEK